MGSARNCSKLVKSVVIQPRSQYLVPNVIAARSLSSVPFCSRGLEESTVTSVLSRFRLLNPAAACKRSLEGAEHSRGQFLGLTGFRNFQQFGRGDRLLSSALVYKKSLQQLTGVRSLSFPTSTVVPTSVKQNRSIFSGSFKGCNDLIFKATICGNRLLSSAPICSKSFHALNLNPRRSVLSGTFNRRNDLNVKEYGGRLLSSSVTSNKGLQALNLKPNRLVLYGNFKLWNDLLFSKNLQGLTSKRTAWRRVFQRVGSVGPFRGLKKELLGHYGRCYFELSKANLSFFVVSTAAVGFVLGSGEFVDWVALGWTSLGTMLAAASANAFNQILEVTNDAQMRRTMKRPLPSGRIGVPHALLFAVTAGITGVTILASKTTPLAGELGAANILLYALVYTPLKQIHVVNTWVGAIVGAIPPMMGWAAATGRVDDLKGWILPFAMCFWQITHFMALAHLFRADYAKGGYKMLSVKDIIGRRTALCALRNCVYLLPLGFVAQYLGLTTGWFAGENLLLTVGMGASSVLFYLSPSLESARKVFRTSLLYLPIVMSAMVVHRIPNSASNSTLNSGLHLDLSSEGPLRKDGILSGKVLLGGELVEDEYGETGRRSFRQRVLQRNEESSPPISALSVAPFPFLPAPGYY